MNVIETKNLTYTYGAGTPFSKTAIEDVNIAIKKGEFIGLIGHTGSGKSTLLRCINGLEKYNGGEGGRRHGAYDTAPHTPKVTSSTKHGRISERS